MPRQLVAEQPRAAAIKTYDERPVGPDEVRVQVEFASPKHGSELAAFRGESPHLKEYYDPEWRAFLPRAADTPHGDGAVRFGEWNLGNQWVGTIREAGSAVSDYKVGDRVCGYGGIRETHIVKAVDNFYLLKMRDGMSWQNAVCLDPAIFALGAVRDAGLRLGDRVAVFGLGAIGQLAAQMARLAGASYVAVVDPIAERREAALRTGADRAFDPAAEDVGLRLKEDTDRLGVDVVIETSASEAALQQVLRGLAYGGTIAFTGWARAFRGGLDLGKEAHFNNARIIFSRACSEPNPDHPRWSFRRIEEACWEMLSAGVLNGEPVIHPVVPFADSASAYENFVDRHPERSIKLGVAF